MIRIVFAALSLAVATTGVLAQSKDIPTRKAIMKKVGDDTRTGAGMVRGEAPYDQAKAQAILATYLYAAEQMPGLYPDDSKTGGETTASPKIWETMADFKTRWEVWGKDVKDAQASVKDLATFRVAFSSIAKGCGGCHDAYRVKR